MNAHEDGVRRAVSDRDALIERNEDIGVARHYGAQLRFAELAVQPLRDVECDLLFRRSITADCAAVFAAMSRIDHHRGEAAAGVFAAGDFVRGAARQGETGGDQAETSDAAEHCRVSAEL